jgi:ferric-dicitrate binding protein FerR (iron transport regulator)
LGTKFNLLARENDAEVQLSLEEGHVSLLSFLSKEEKEAFAGQQAILNKATGVITIHSMTDIQTNSFWRRGELIFSNAKLSDVLAALENNYTIKIDMPARFVTSGDLFTGVIPANNLLEALEILKLSYHLDYTVLEHQVLFKSV